MMPCKLLKLKMVKMMYAACRVCAARLVVSGDGRTGGRAGGRYCILAPIYRQCSENARVLEHRCIERHRRVTPRNGVMCF